MKTFLLTITACVTVLLTSCASTTPLTPQERASFRTIKLQNEFTAPGQYTKVGTTAFNNSSDSINDPELFAKFDRELKSALKQRGYNIVSNGGNATLKVMKSYALMDARTKRIVSGPSVLGTAFLGIQRSHSANGFTISLVDSAGKTRIRESFDKAYSTVKKTHGKFNEFTASEQKTLLDPIKADYSSAINQTLTKMGL